MLIGPNIELSKNIADATSGRVTLSGGVSGYQDLNEVNQEFDNGIDSVIIGRALYENAFPCQKIWRVAESGIFN
jgi:phosphoribosylformimino-5-aminoimidazole carboxamide ribotide isomerase